MRAIITAKRILGLWVLSLGCFRSLLHSETKRRASLIPIFLSRSQIPREKISLTIPFLFEAGQKMRPHLQPAAHELCKELRSLMRSELQYSELRRKQTNNQTARAHRIDMGPSCTAHLPAQDTASTMAKGA